MVHSIEKQPIFRTKQGDAMKTFKLAGFRIEHNGQFKEIPFEDGLVINKENKSKQWLIEVFTSDAHHDFFRAILENEQDLRVEANITRTENPPASFRMTVISIRKVNNRISVLLEGRLQRKRTGELEQVLQDLMKQGFSGEEILRQLQKIRAGQISGQTQKIKKTPENKRR